MDINQIRNLLRVNGVSDFGDESKIRSILSGARYSEQEISAALLMLKGVSAAPPVQTASVPVVQAQTASPEVKEKRKGIQKLLPEKWLSVKGIVTGLFLYFCVAPAIGFGLLLFLGMIPGVGLIGMLFLYLGLHYTGIAAVMNAYAFMGYHGTAMALNATTAPYEVMSVSCQPYEMRVEGQHHYAVQRSYFDAAPIGYTLNDSLEGYVTFSNGKTSERIQVLSQMESEAGQKPKDANLTPPPVVTESLLYRFPIYLKGSDEYNYGRNYVQDDLVHQVPYLRLSSSLFSKEDFAAIKSCLSASQQEKGVTLRNQTTFLSAVAGVYLGGDSSAQKSTPSTFTCADGLHITTIPPHYLGLSIPQGGGEPPDVLRLATINDDGSVRTLSADEINDLTPSSYAMMLGDFTHYNNCLLYKKDCPADVWVKVADNKPNTYHMEKVTPVSDSYRYNWEMNYMRGYYAKQLQPLGLENGLPASFDACTSSDGVTVRDAFRP